ncbi:nitroreductase family protein [Victivallis sp. Marseille-Q1083]|uniref:nitroreductase family protein n=1 Tax=Victivallis sp. Marseille-Q1083 TaxID=2717288 RepID=UPI00158A98D9|nr:nitroreductase family protein [Victivallis sp. Marseille-Q1083]
MDFNTLLARRRTIRRFQQRPVPEEALRRMLEAARQSSCAANLQRLRYLVLRDESLVGEIFRHTRYAAKVAPRRNPVPGETAPRCFIAVYSDATPNNHLYADAGAAIQSMELMAADQELGCCWIGAFDARAVESLLDFSAPRRLLYLLAVGYPAEMPVGETVALDEDASYYLDDRDVLHVPKYRLDDLVSWR